MAEFVLNGKGAQVVKGGVAVHLHILHKIEMKNFLLGNPSIFFCSDLYVLQYNTKPRERNGGVIFRRKC